MELELASEGHQGAHEVGARPGGRPHPREPGVGPLVFIFCEDFSLFFLRCSVEFQDIPRIFISCTKNNTMAVLLKTASVRVSSIQIIQVRVQNKGKSFWKSRYDGDVSAVSSPLPSLGVSTMYMSCDEVAVRRPVGAGSCSSPASSSLSMSSESKLSMSVKSSTVATKWVVGGSRIS